MKFREWLRNFLKTNLVIIILVFTAWFKLIAVDLIMFHETKGLSVIFFVAFTAASSLLIFTPAFLFNKFKNWAGLTIAFLLSLLVWADVVYWRYFGSLIKVETLSIANQTTGVGDSILNLLSPLDVLFFVDILILGYLLVRKRGIPRPAESLKSRLITAGLILFVSLLPISAIFWRDRADQLDRFIYHNYDMNSIEFRYGLVGAHGINTYRYVLTAMEHLDKSERREAVDWITEHTTYQTSNQYTGKASGKNIFLLQVESLQSFVVGRKYNGQEITPNLNRLASGSYFLPDGQLTTGGGQTSDSDFAANTSVYPLQNSSVFVQYGNDNFTSLPKALKANNYTVNAYHAYRRDFWNRGPAYNSLGFSHFFAKEEYQDGDNIGMGLNDESFYHQSLDKLVINKDQPAFNYLISLSSHHPFIMNPKFETLEGDILTADQKTYHYYQAIHYADKALGIFLEELKNRGLYEDSLIVVYGDHSAKIGDYSDPKMAKMVGKLTAEELSSIPFFYKLPNQQIGERLLTSTSQLDIMPTILNLTGAKTDYPMFGGDALTGIKKDIKRVDAIHYSDLMIRFNLFEEFAK